MSNSRLPSERDPLVHPIYVPPSYAAADDAYVPGHHMDMVDAAPAPPVDYRRRRKKKSRCVIFGPLMAAACVAAFAWTMYLNRWHLEDWTINPMIGPSREALVAAGAKDVERILEGEWWRWAMPMFLHGGVIHLFFNLLSLFRVGYPMERQFGAWRIGALYLLSGVAATVASAAFLPDMVSVGASGSIFGLLGGVWADLLVNSSKSRFDCCEVLDLVVMTLLNLALGLLPFLDNFAHVGGLICGFLCGLVLLHEPRPKRRYQSGCSQCCSFLRTLLRVLAFLALLVGLPAGFYAVYQGIDPNEWCGWCKYLSCLPIPGPWGCDALNPPAGGPLPPPGPPMYPYPYRGG